jgi:ubiquitin carboxyl-terminal hydrolase 7
LKNLGNTCYLNAQLQCHFHIPFVRKIILESSSPSAVANPQEGTDQDHDKEESVALQALRSVFHDMTAAGTTTPTRQQHSAAATTTASPRILCQKLGINVFEQQDSQEFWKLLLPAIHLPRLTRLYQGTMEDYILALDGSKREKRRQEPFLDLSLPVDNHDNRGSSSLQTALTQMFQQPELLSNAQGNGWRPEKGADYKVDAHKGSLLRPQNLPSILQLHLKRFQYDYQTDRTVKLHTAFDVPLQLDLTTVCTLDDDNDGDNNKNKVPADMLLYELQAIVIHVGDFGAAGHYYAYVRPNIGCDDDDNDKTAWYRLDDEQVVPVSWQDVQRDATNNGGSASISSSSSSSPSNNNNKTNFWSRIERFLPLKSRASSSSSSMYGYGGKTSSAYVLQYVRRSDVPMLYLKEDKVDS